MVDTELAQCRLDNGSGTAPVRCNDISPNAGSVLVADSDTAHRAWIADTLTERGYAVALAANGEEALARLKSGGIGLLVCAMTMSGMDGLELLRALRDSAVLLPVIVIAANMSEIDRLCLKGASLLGASATFTQPLTPSVFLGRVSDLIAPRSR
jgi:CheY-like chemotaxis protein